MYIYKIQLYQSVKTDELLSTSTMGKLMMDINTDSYTANININDTITNTNMDNERSDSEISDWLSPNKQNHNKRRKVYIESENVLLNLHVLYMFV